jgi:Tol biopolymer transport system component
MVKRRTAFPPSYPELKLQQLTTNSYENRVLSGAISPDGKYLAYADINGMHIKRIATGAIENVPQPPVLKDKDFGWEINPTAWFPDSTGFVANARPPVSFAGIADSAGTSIWLVSALGGIPKRLRDNAAAYSVSPDGSLVSFGSKPGKIGDREIWTMRPSGEQAQKLYEVGEDSTIGGLIWTSDGQRVLYFKSDRSTDGSNDSVVSRDLGGGPTTTLLSPAKLKEVSDLSLLPDGRLIYAVKEPPPMSDTCNYWVTRIDPRTGQTIEQPRKLTHETGFCMNSAGATADGKRFAFVQWKPHLISYVAELASGGRQLLHLRHFPLNDTMDCIAAWTADGKAVILSSNRIGRFGIYKQSLDADTAEAVVTKGYGSFPQVTPDGKWIVYLGSTQSGGYSPIEYSPTEPLPVMRVAVNGGPSERLFTAKPWAFITCSRSASGVCVLAEPSDDRQQAIVTSLDALKGRGAELARFPLDPNNNDWFVDLSPDGTRLATMMTPTSPIKILSLRHGSTQQVNVKGWSNFLGFRWAADGRFLFVVSGPRGQRTLLHVDLQGNAQVLWEGSGSADTLAIPSRDGRRLAISNWTTDSNIWMMENF